MNDPAADLALISSAARAAGRIALEHRQRGLQVSRKADGSPVTDGDLAVDAFLHETLRAARPDYGWLSEETPDDLVRLQSRHIFIVDPIDGTSAYVGDRPWFAVAIAVVEDGRPLAGVVHAPALDEHYAASLGGGARCNDTAMRASEVGELEGATLTGDPNLLRSSRWPEPWPALTVVRRNALAYRLAVVGAGQFDGTLSLGWKNDWDLAAGDLIAREAGALCTDPRGTPLRFNTPRAQNPGLVCAGAGLHPLILARTAPIDLPA